jgi:hypothetical protein
MNSEPGSLSPERRTLEPTAMNADTTTKETPVAAQGPAIEVRLRRLWIGHTCRQALVGCAWVLGALGILIGVDLLIDWLLNLPGWFRLILLAANLILLAGVAWFKFGQFLRRFDIIDHALGVERAAPELGGVLISGIQLDQQRAEAGRVSGQLVGAVKRMAQHRAQSLDWSRVAPRVLIRSGLCFAAAGIVIIGAIGIWDARFLNVLAVRMLNPASALAYPTDTNIELADGNKIVRAGQPVTLAANTHGAKPETGELYIRFAGLDWETIPLTGHKGAFEHTLSRATDDLDYHFRLGDARSPKHHVTVVRPPRIVDGRVHLRYPAYTNMGGQEVRTFNVKAPEGTDLRWELKLDKPVAAADLRLEGGDTRGMTVSGDGREASLDLPAAASQPYVIALHWRFEGQIYIDEGPRHYIQIVPDTDPQVGLLSPTEDTKGTLHKTIPIVYWARDDYGLTESAIVYSVNDGGELRRKLPSIAGKYDTEEQYYWPITKLLPTLKLGDIVTFAVEVTDGRPDAPGKTRSVSRRVQFVSDREYAAYIGARQRKYLGRLRPIYKQQREAVKQLETIETQRPTE